jgi:CBS domain-containing protein/anti-sigma regulatory factor (Ser/Thr protein kinase)
MSNSGKQSDENAEMTRAHGFVYELSVKELMTTDVITIAPESTMRELMTVLREKRVSGVPVTKDGSIIGIISIEDLIKALAEQRLEDSVEKHMTERIISVGTEEKALQAVKLFAEHGYGRLPVIDPNGFLVGIITQSDITRGFMSALSKGFQGEQIKKYRVSHIFEDTSSDSTSLVLRYYVVPKDFEEGGKASSTLKRMLERLLVDPDLVKRITISAYEAEMNLIIHTDNGGEIRVEISPERIVLITEDKGPGIEDVEEALKPGYSTAPDWVRGLGFGAGMGLCNIKRYSDEISLVSEPGKGTVLNAIFEVRPKAQ